MNDWLSYSPEDFLMFSERTYRRLVETYNTALWPVAVAAILAGVFLMVRLIRRREDTGRGFVLLLAAAWLVVAVAWFWMRFSTIHTGGRIMAAAFMIESAALGWFALARTSDARPFLSGIGGVIASAILAYGILLQPFLAAGLGRAFAQSEIFGLAPDPTVAATFGALALARRSPCWLWLVPIGWSLFSTLTLYAMHTPDWVSPAAVVLLAIVARLAGRRHQTSNPA